MLRRAELEYKLGVLKFVNLVVHHNMEGMRVNRQFC